MVSNTEQASQAVGAHGSRLRITEIFYSLQGESRSVGIPTVFIRLTGCPLRCAYCDTDYAFQGGQWLSIEEIMARVSEYAPRYVTVTGGEPLAQRRCRTLLTMLCDAGYFVSIETSGAVDIQGVDGRVSIVMDLKTPGSGEADKNLTANLEHLLEKDQLKFVLSDRADYEWARAQLAEFDLSNRCEILMSPSHGELDPTDLAEWILADNLPVRLQVQLHKLLWNGGPGR